jgi:hypothetical protein
MNNINRAKDIMFQSTLPHGERLCLKFIVTLPIVVSIHAPARGATNYITGLDFNSRCFNPRSRTGSDGEMNDTGADTTGFNPRSRTGSDPRGQAG